MKLILPKNGSSSDIKLLDSKGENVLKKLSDQGISVTEINIYMDTKDLIYMELKANLFIEGEVDVDESLIKILDYSEAIK